MGFINKNKNTTRGKYYPPKKKVCIFCTDKEFSTDFKDGVVFRRFLTERGKILPRRMTGTCAKHQRKITSIIKNSRHIGLLPFVVH